MRVTLGIGLVAVGCASAFTNPTFVNHRISDHGIRTQHHEKGQHGSAKRLDTFRLSAMKKNSKKTSKSSNLGTNSYLDNLTKSSGGSTNKSGAGSYSDYLSNLSGSAPSSAPSYPAVSPPPPPAASVVPPPPPAAAVNPPPPPAAAVNPPPPPAQPVAPPPPPTAASTSTTTTQSSGMNYLDHLSGPSNTSSSTPPKKYMPKGAKPAGGASFGSGSSYLSNLASTSYVPPSYSTAPPQQSQPTKQVAAEVPPISTPISTPTEVKEATPAPEAKQSPPPPKSEAAKPTPKRLPRTKQQQPYVSTSLWERAPLDHRNSRPRQASGLGKTTPATHSKRTAASAGKLGTESSVFSRARVEGTSVLNRLKERFIDAISGPNDSAQQSKPNPMSNRGPPGPAQKQQDKKPQPKKPSGGKNSGVPGSYLDNL